MRLLAEIVQDRPNGPQVLYDAWAGGQISDRDLRALITDAWCPEHPVEAGRVACGHRRPAECVSRRGLKTSAIWLIYVAAHAEKLVGLLGGATMTEHLNAMGVGRWSAAAPISGPRR